MCMSKVTWQCKSMSNTRSKDKWQKGYKIFFVGEKGETIKFPYYGFRSSLSFTAIEEKTVILNRIYKADKTTTSGGTGWIEVQDVKYMTGFHIFPQAIQTKLYSAWYKMENHMIFEVEYRKVSALGEHKVNTKYPVDCVIAQEMRVLRPLTYDEIQSVLDSEDKIDRTDVSRQRRNYD